VTDTSPARASVRLTLPRGYWWAATYWPLTLGLIPPRGFHIWAVRFLARILARRVGLPPPPVTVRVGPDRTVIIEAVAEEAAP
jgi:hypothetical protein